MKFKFDRKYLKICLYAFVTIAALLLFHRILQASENVWQSLLGGLSFLLSLVSPFILAILIAYILSPAVSGLEKLTGKLFKKDKFKRGRKFFALIFVYAAVITVIVVTLSFVIPGIVRNIKDLIENWGDYQKSLLDYYNNFLMTYPLFSSETVQNMINTHLTGVQNALNAIAADITSIVLRILSSIFSFVIALILSFYLLNEREAVIGSFNRLLRARLGDGRADSVMDFLTSVDRVFGRYISAKLLICLIMFAISFAAFGLLGVRYVVLMAAVVALSTLVPYIGPFVGAVPPIVISLIESPEKALYTGIALLAMHLVDGYFIEPVVFGERMGLSPFWILLSIILGGGLFGLWGVLLAVPVAAVIKLLIVGYVRRRQARRQEQQ